MDEELVARICSAFGDAPRPGDDELLHPDCMDDCDILQFYGGVRWQDMTDEMVIYNYAAPTAFSAKAFRYYLPAFLIWTLRNPGSPEYAGEALLRALDPGTSAELLHDFRRSHFDALDPDEVAVVREFLRKMSGHPALAEYAEAALVNHWIEA